MTWALEAPLRVGDTVCGVIAITEVKVRRWGGAVAGSGEKRPVLVLVLRDGEVSGVDLGGRRVEADEIEQLDLRLP